MKALPLLLLTVAICESALIGCKPTAEQQRQIAEEQRKQEERWRKVDEFAAKRVAREAQVAGENAQKRVIESARHHKLANASISFDDFSVRIENADVNDWPEMNVYVNPGFFGPISGYGIRLPALKAGKSLTIPLKHFTKDNGERFNPSACRITELWIGGGDYDYEELSGN